MVAALKADEIAAIVFVDIAVIIVVARLMGALFRRLRQPAVVGEIIGGILLGPSLLGAFPGHLTARLFPLEVRPYLKIVAQLGLIIFMFIVGLELDINLIRGKERIAAIVSLSSIALPFGLGLLLAGYLHGDHDVVVVAGRATTVDFVPFALFIGASMSVTAFPVLARILTERGMYRTEIGALAMACAAVDDILAWSLLAVVLAVVASSGALDLPRILVESALFVTFMFVVVRPRLALLADRYRKAGRLTPDILAVILVGFLVSAFVTSKIGIHSIFGAFLFGVIMPRTGTAAFFHEILERLEQVSVLLLLPVFFVATGLEADVTGLGRDALSQLPAILAVACLGKFVGASAAARLQGLAPRKAAAIGILMNTRGLTELVILNVGLSFGVLDERLFTMLVVMAIVTTVMTEPLLRLVYPDKQLARDVAEAERAALGVPDAYRVLVPAGRLLDLAIDLVGEERPSEIVLTRFRKAPPRLEIGSGLAGELTELAASLDELKALAAHARDRGVESSVRARLSDDPDLDLAAQATAVEADVLLLDGGDPAGVARVLGASTVTAAVASPGLGATTDRSRPVVVAAGDGTGGAVAVQLALRIARSRGAAVRIVEPGRRRASRRATAWVAQLGRAGIAATAADGQDVAEEVRATGAGLVVVDGGLAAPATDVAVLVVRPGEDEDEGCVERLVNRLLSERAPA